ncbi:amidohydrolase [Sporolactobacillus spathodeae]|uniref:Amidohydrolase n=1 Tax=Sporolactobacillus spathodeae TaxID=1465502 RepID=A0ABS2Q9V4_9BACL|nr:amidohydrolase [Sporolactobacillus spathodeae]
MIALEEETKQQIIGYFNHLHEHPEISMQEFQTTNYLQLQLEQLGWNTKRFADCPGVIGEIGSGRPIIGLRADMDALWQHVGGSLRANHSCGHDAHMAMALGAARLLPRLPRAVGTVRLLFQPAEETGEGALAFCDRGVAGDLDYLFGVHLRPQQETRNGLARPAIFHGACRTITGTISGLEAHASRPHLGINAIEAAAMIATALNQIHLDPMISYSVKMTQLHAGTAANIIPGQASFTLDLRAETNEAMADLTEKTRCAVQNATACSGATVTLTVPEGSPASAASVDAMTIMTEAIREELGNECCKPPLPSSGGDDFNHYARRFPKLKTTMLALGCDLTPGLHHPQMQFNHDAIFDGVRILTTAILLALKKSE